MFFQNTYGYKCAGEKNHCENSNCDHGSTVAPGCLRNISHRITMFYLSLPVQLCANAEELKKED